LIVVAGLGFILVPTIAAQVGNLVNALPAYLDELESGGGWLAGLVERLDLIERVQGAGEAIAGTAIGLLRSVGNAAFHTVIVFVLTPSFAYTLPNIKRWAVRLLSRERREDFLFVLDRSTDMIAHYMLGNLVVGFVAGVTAFIFLTILGVPYALALAAFVAVTDLIPAVGATIGGLAAVAVAAFTGIPQLIGTLIFMVVYQQLENHVVIPRVMKRAIDLSPAVVIVSLLVGAQVAGLVGVLLALPVAAMIKVVIVEFIVADRIETVRSADAAEATKGPRRFRRRGEKLGQRPLP
jgi:predicted PurR-regulated permease PerM